MRALWFILFLTASAGVASSEACTSTEISVSGGHSNITYIVNNKTFGLQMENGSASFAFNETGENSSLVIEAEGTGTLSADAEGNLSGIVSSDGESEQIFGEYLHRVFGFMKNIVFSIWLFG